MRKSSLLKSAIKWAPVVYPIVKKFLNSRKATKRH
ncbi:hypothetical protein ACFO0S_11665 [Chryseomicrobium palamuruense]|uniref:Uncharacterized protein n=1 Tax=Chryseomicrobium palamuruense TaxID=682973 RepID=A0ABV8UXJ4_9BACL